MLLYFKVCYFGNRYYEDSYGFAWIYGGNNYTIICYVTIFPRCVTLVTITMRTVMVFFCPDLWDQHLYHNLLCYYIQRCVTMVTVTMRTVMGFFLPGSMGPTPTVYHNFLCYYIQRCVTLVTVTMRTVMFFFFAQIYGTNAYTIICYVTIFKGVLLW